MHVPGGLGLCPWLSFVSFSLVYNIMVYILSSYLPGFGALVIVRPGGVVLGGWWWSFLYSNADESELAAVLAVFCSLPVSCSFFLASLLSICRVVCIL
jgi:hypothetical protein